MKVIISDFVETLVPTILAIISIFGAMMAVLAMVTKKIPEPMGLLLVVVALSLAGLIGPFLGYIDRKRREYDDQK